MKTNYLSLSQLSKRITYEKKRGKKIVFTNGCFDIIHGGHIKLFEEAKKLGDILIVAINSDKSIKKLKGNLRPIIPQNQRAKIISAIKYVDYVMIFDEPTPYKTIKILKPDILVKGADYPLDQIVGRNLVKKVVRVKLLRNASTSKIIKKIIKWTKEYYE